MSIVNTLEQKILPVMVGTAGHVDHGKTALVKLLTGCDTDSLPEEKARGMSIDLGFAPFILEDSRMVGIIDVPGHEDFIRNMVAGASSIDVLILVIAADDGIMPQTIEHLKIVSLLRTPLVMAVVTKIDMVSIQRQQEVKNDVEIFLGANGFAGAPIILESNRTQEGLSEVRAGINKLVGDVERPLDRRAFRMHIERAFSIKGISTVVTGIPLSGSCAVGDQLELFPGPRSTICKAIQKYNRESRDTEAHVCSAINIKDIRASDIQRGMTIAAAGIFRQTSSAILSVRNVHESIKIKRRQEIRFCCGTSNRIVSGLLLHKSSLGPGESGFMQIKFDSPMLIAAGDRFILRWLSPSQTVAGGVVLTANVELQKKRISPALERLEIAQDAVGKNDFFQSELIAGNSAVFSRNDLSWLVQNGSAQKDQIVSEKIRLGIISPLSTANWVINSRICEIEEKLCGILNVYHKKNKFSIGMLPNQVCVELGLENVCLGGLKRIFENSSKIKTSENYFALKSFSPGLSAVQLALKEKIIKTLTHSGKSAVAYSSLQSDIEASNSDMQILVRILRDESLIVTIDNYLVAESIVKECLEALLELFGKERIVELGMFRQATGLSRNFAVTILEFFDSKGITCREGNGRRLLRKTYKV